MSVPMFKNLTTRFELDVKLTRAVIGELVARGKVRIASDPAVADAVLEGEITGFTRQPHRLRRREPGRPVQRHRDGQGRAEGTWRQGAAVLRTRPSSISRSTRSRPASSFESLQTEAIDKIADKFARSLVVSILEGF
ncbi:MAG: LPS assembly lipoprotein LptE [Ignavibacteriales bacterium]|nr:LPS assembly lipoprotein LptE [Ignavibacteriales bacterium]